LQMTDVQKIIDDPKYREFRSLGIIDEVGVRNLKIKKDFNELRKVQTIFQAELALSEKYNLSEYAIHSILFRKRIKKLFPSKILKR
jgi:hypothetical protein